MVTTPVPPQVSQLPSEDAAPPSIAGAFLLFLLDFMSGFGAGAERSQTPVNLGSPSGGSRGRLILDRCMIRLILNFNKNLKSVSKQLRCLSGRLVQIVGADAARLLNTPRGLPLLPGEAQMLSWT